MLFFTAAFSTTVIEEHFLHVDLDPTVSVIKGRDKIVARTDGKFWEFELSANLTIHTILIRNNERLFEKISNEDANSRGQAYYRLKRKFLESKKQILDITYSGALYQETGESSFSREKIAMEISATISEEGVFLSPAGGYYPRAQEVYNNFETVIKLPAGWDAVSEGKLLNADKNPLFSEIHFKTEHPMDGIFITAALWTVYKEIVDGVEFYTYFFEEDTSLAKDYLNMSIGYVQMYSEMLSPYPFSKFAVVENFFPTGYGMPSYTVLGRSVVHLPFIVYTSLGHEVLHNWWGNSVYIGDGGNWCEGLTAYQADYYYKLQKSEADARQYRKEILKDFTVYVNAENDFAPADFVSRTDMASRTIGYGKVAMIFHMIEEMIGTEDFIQALKTIIAENSFQPAGFSDFIAAFQKHSGKDLQFFLEHWINEAGNPSLNLEVKSDKFYLHQSGAIKPLQVPIHMTYKNGRVTEGHVFTDTETIELSVPDAANIRRIAVDPDYNVMRRLHKSELDATIRHLLSEETFVFVIPNNNDEWQDLAQTFNGYISEQNELMTFLPHEALPQLPVIYLGVLPDDLSDLQINGDLLVNDIPFEADSHSLVWAFQEENGIHSMAIYSSNPKELIPLARKIPHYGKYGYLVFEHGQNVAKGNHESANSPLVWTK